MPYASNANWPTLLTACALVTMAVPAFGQAGASIAGKDGDADAHDPNQIVVTATERAENVQDVPIAITALDADK